MYFFIYMKYMYLVIYIYTQTYVSVYTQYIQVCMYVKNRFFTDVRNVS